MTIARDIAAWISASTTKKGPIERATQAESDAGTADKYVTPATVRDGDPLRGALIEERIYTLNGTWTKPDNGRLVEVTCVGGGGGGAGATVSTTPNWRMGGAGGGGGMCSANIDADDLGATAAVVVGSGGAGGTTTGSGGTGAASSFNGTTGTYVYATGGNAGIYTFSANFAPSHGTGGQGVAGNYIGSSRLRTTGAKGGGGAVFGGAFSGSIGGGCPFSQDVVESEMLAATSGSKAGKSGAVDNYGSGGGGAIVKDSVTGATGGAGRAGIVIVRSYG